jgi:hypothetical protein
VNSYSKGHAPKLEKKGHVNKEISKRSPCILKNFTEKVFLFKNKKEAKRNKIYWI